MESKMRSYQQREISDVPENDLRAALLKSLPFASQYNQLFPVIANQIAKARGAVSAVPAGNIVPRDTLTGFAIGEFELNYAVQGRLHDLLHELSLRGYVVPGLA